MTINPFVGRGLRRYTKKHLRHDRDAARHECNRLKERLQRSAETNRRLNEEKGDLAGQVRDLEQQVKVSDGLIESLQSEIRDLKAGSSETTQSIPRRDLPQGDKQPHIPDWAVRDDDTVQPPALADQLVQGVA